MPTTTLRTPKALETMGIALHTTETVHQYLLIKGADILWGCLES